MKNASISLNITFQKKISRPGSSATRRYFLRIDLFLFCEKIDWDTCRSKYYEFLTFWYTTWSKASVVVRSTWRQSWYPCKINLCERSTVQFNNVNQEIGISRRIQSKKMFWNKQSLTSQKYRFIVRKFCQALCLFPVYVYASEETLFFDEKILQNMKIIICVKLHGFIIIHLMQVLVLPLRRFSMVKIWLKMQKKWRKRKQSWC